MATNTVKMFKHGLLEIADSGGFGGMNSISVPMGEGAFGFTETQEIKVKKDRGVLDHMLKGEEEPVQWTLDAEFRGFLGATGTADASTLIYEALNGISSASDWDSDEPNSDVHAVQIRLTLTDPGDSTIETLTLTRSAKGSLQFEEGEDGDTFSIQGISMLTVPAIA